MNLPKQLASNFREIYFGGNWTASNLKDNLKDITWQQATTQVYSLNTIATLVYHINYFVIAITAVLNGNSLDAHDKYSFDAPLIQCEEEWKNLVNKVFADAETCASLIEQLPEPTLWLTFADEKYSTYFRNINGVIEHNHYHLGQIALIKKIISETRIAV